ncbi:MAG TPA: trehalose-6-phosphate synthase [Candidatus Paceibacterota bacterium]|jgi:trehalose 6-phosphate synthase|nr:trehalose-6-phosphate synthase [Candidatus Paceibacterota bacterium]
MRQIATLTAAVIIAVTLIAGLFALSEANDTQVNLSATIQSRTQVVADSIAGTVAPALRADATSTVRTTLDKLSGEERVAGVGVYDVTGNPIAFSSNMPSNVTSQTIITTSMDSDQPQSSFTSGPQGSLFVLADPIDQNGHVIGDLVVVQNAQYITDAVWNIWRTDLIRLFLEILLFGGAIAVLVRFVFYRAIRDAADAVRSLRAGRPDDTSGTGFGFFEPLTSEIKKMSASLQTARRAASEEARMRLEKLDSPWTADRLKEFIKAYLKDRPIFVISNAEPYVHSRANGRLQTSVPAGGVITAIEPVMEACGGVWIAQGSGNADKEMVDEDGKLQVPPEEPRYTLKRVFLTPEERAGYYDGVSNEALWPLCHLAHVRPQFRSEDWVEYRKVNALFAKALLDEVRHIERPIVLVQDFHLALVPSLIKKSRPDAQVAIFWHIPWPSAAQFSICPWRKEILEGMLGADLVGFHTQQYCNNFLDTVAQEIEARIDYERFAVVRGGHETRVDPFPISIAFPGEAEITTPPDKEMLDRLNIKTEFLALGVDRLDYIKGIPERFRGVEFFLQTYPEYLGRFTFLQIASPTRAGVEKYREYAEQVLAEAERINNEFGTADWRPIIVEHRSYSHGDLRKLYQLADICMVTSIHDGMNLVAKEYVAARSEENGVLILSNFTGASRDLASALSVNPYSAEESAEAIYQALIMPESEQRRRMKAMRNAVRDYNVYRWSAEIIKALANL